MNDQPIDPRELASLSVSDFAAAAAGKQAIPGGGSVAGVVGALAAALAEMALNLTRGKKAFAAHEAEFAAIAARLQRARGAFEQLIADDAEAYRLYRQAQADAADSDRKQLALAAAIDVPREAQVLAIAVLEEMLSLADRCNRWVISDLAAGAVLAEATVRLSDYNVRINVGAYADRAGAEDVRRASAEATERARELSGKIDAAASRYFQ